MFVKPKLLVFTDWYLPGYKAGGPIQSCKNLVNLLKEDYQIYIVTSDRDLGDQKAYENIVLDQWIAIENTVKVIYLSPSSTSISKFHQLIQDVDPEYLYLNSMFSPSFTIKPILAYRKLSKQPILILSPRGMLRSGALKYKAWKKFPFLKLLQWMKFSKKIIFHATDSQEVEDIKKYFPNRSIHLIGNVPNFSSNAIDRVIEKKSGVLELVYISRVSSIKNIHLLLEWLSTYPLKGKWKLTVYGESESESFSEVCKKLSVGLPVVFKGGIKSNLVEKELSKYHVFILPSKGENFGHAIFEAFNAGLPVIISDQTPWVNLENKNAGFDLPLNSPISFINSIQFFINMSENDYVKWSKCSQQVAIDYISESQYKQKYYQLFS